jgi:hypothetical protein
VRCQPLLLLLVRVPGRASRLAAHFDAASRRAQLVVLWRRRCSRSSAVPVGRPYVFQDRGPAAGAILDPGLLRAGGAGEPEAGAASQAEFGRRLGGEAFREKAADRGVVLIRLGRLRRVRGGQCGDGCARASGVAGHGPFRSVRAGCEGCRQVRWLSVDRVMLAGITAQQHEHAVAGHRAETPAAIRADLDAAFARARDTGDLTVLTTTVRRWWIEAVEWRRDPAGQRGFLARMDRYLAAGPPGPERRVTREKFRACLGA